MRCETLTSRVRIPFVSKRHVEVVRSTGSSLPSYQEGETVDRSVTVEVCTKAVSRKEVQRTVTIGYPIFVMVAMNVPESLQWQATLLNYGMHGIVIVNPLGFILPG